MNNVYVMIFHWKASCRTQVQLLFSPKSEEEQKTKMWHGLANQESSHEQTHQHSRLHSSILNQEQMPHEGYLYQTMQVT